jgi:hypothetical protein
VQTKIRRAALFAGVIAASLLAVSSIGVAAQDAETAKVRVLHASPDAPAVDVYADGAKVLSGVAFGRISDYMEVPAGDHHLQVFAADADPAADTAVIDATVTLAAGTATTVAATNSIDSIEAQVILDAPTPTNAGPQVRFVHLSADTPPIDIAPDGGDELVTALAYPGASEYLSVPAGQLDVEIRPAGAVDGWVVANPGGVFLSAGHSYSQFVVGSLADDTFRLVTAIDAVASAPVPAKVRVLHASPDAPAVDVYADGAQVLTNVAFGTISDYMDVPAGDHQLQVFAAGSDPAAGGAVIDATVTFAEGTAYTVAATNDLASIEAQVIVDDPAPVADSAQIRVVHLSADAPAIAVAADGSKDLLIKKLAYPKASKYLTVPAGDYDLEARVAGKKTVALQLDPITVEAGTSYSVFAIGSAKGGTLQAVIATDATVAP